MTIFGGNIPVSAQFLPRLDYFRNLILKEYYRAMYSTNAVRSIFLNSADWGGENSEILDVHLDPPILNPTKFKVRKIILPNTLYQFSEGINDCFYIQYENTQENITQIPVPTGQVLYSLDQFATFIATALNNATDPTNNWAVVYNYETNRLNFSNGSSQSFRIMTRTDLIDMNTPFSDTLINLSIGIDDNLVSNNLPGGGYDNTQIPTNAPICNLTELYVNASFSTNTLIALDEGRSRRQCILLLPLTKTFNSIVIYNSKSDDWIPYSSGGVLSSFDVYITDRFGRSVNLSQPFTIQLDFSYAS